jgi:hypothetical protein
MPGGLVAIPRRIRKQVQQSFHLPQQMLDLAPGDDINKNEKDGCARNLDGPHL